MPKAYIIVAGPQAAGKSTLVKHLSSKYDDVTAFLGRTEKILSHPSEIIPLEESRQIVVHKRQLKGAIFMDYLDELEVIFNDQTRMFKILREEEESGDHRKNTYIDECNVFTLGHAKAHGIDLLNGYYIQYSDMLKFMNSAVIFLDSPPSTSWERRKGRYEQRLWDATPDEKIKTMRAYQEYLERLYPALLGIYEMLELPKVKIKSSGTLEETLKKGEDAFGEMLAKVA
ncbi:AAA family ATPase [Candidatus Woesearchaeota archaeon]|nr:AAA family ATPase [Candidatus Woesearchaeota archaeon]